MQRFFEIKENYRIIEVKCNFSMCRVTIGKLLKLNNYYFVYICTECNKKMRTNFLWL